MTHMSDDDGTPESMDITDLFAAVPDQPAPYLPVATGNVDTTAKLGDAILRVMTTDDQIRMTLAGSDGMVTVRFGPNDAQLLMDLLHAGQSDIRTRRRGDRW